MPDVPSAWQRPVLRTDEEFDQHRAVSWLELFFDSVFVVVIARLTPVWWKGSYGSILLLWR